MKRSLENNIENVGLLFYLLLIAIMTIGMVQVITYVIQNLNSGANSIVFL